MESEKTSGTTSLLKRNDKEIGQRGRGKLRLNRKRRVSGIQEKLGGD